VVPIRNHVLDRIHGTFGNSPGDGAALTAFSTGLLGLHAKTPGMRREGSVWPTPQGIGLSKDVWLLGAGLSMLTAGRKG